MFNLVLKLATYITYTIEHTSIVQQSETTLQLVLHNPGLLSVLANLRTMTNRNTSYHTHTRQ